MPETIDREVIDAKVAAADEIARRVDAERTRLRAAAGLVQLQQQFKRPVERPFTAAERGKVTILIGGMTWKHDNMFRAVFEGCGYKCETLPVPDVPAFQIGKEFGNNGQCNPTYFTVGCLVQYLQGLERQGVSRQDIVDKYVFFTAGSCGPCRFGMYEAEYRFALENAGFEGFRVLLFQQDDGIKAASGETGLRFTVDFGMGMLNAMNVGDTLNDIIYQIRPFEVQRGETDRAFEEAGDTLTRMLRERPPFEIMERAPNWAKGYLKSHDKFMRFWNSWAKVYENLYGKPYLEALEACRARINEVEVDRTKVKPVVKITGEFWASITEGDGNFNMFRFLEKEGAQVVVEPIGTWICYLMHQVVQQARDEKGLKDGAVLPPSWRLDKHLKMNFAMYKKIAQIKIAERIFKREYNRIIDALGGIGHHLVDQYELQRLGHPYYNSRASGGEGHLEVAKNIYYSHKGLAHMVLALKPFGCMPSTQSDGAQSAVMSHYKDMIFLPIETSGEGDVNAHSRVQMALGEAKAKTKLEFKAALESTGRTLEEIRAYVDEHPELKSPIYKVPHSEGVVGIAANFVRHVAERMKAENKPVQRASAAA